MSAGDFDYYNIVTKTIADCNTGGLPVPGQYNGGWNSGTYQPHTHNINPSVETDYKEVFEKLITFILGSSRVSQDTKDEFINNCIPLSEFRKYVSSYFPQYADKIKLWEKLHGL